MTQMLAKKAAAEKATEWVKSGMTIGLGSGSTAAFFIEALIQKKKRENLLLRAVSSSQASANLATAGGIEVVDLNSVSRVDLTVDGADEVDPQKRMIKGAGGAHLREKILAAASSELLIIIDESKLVPSLGKAPLPVELLPYGAAWARKKLAHLGLSGTFRQGPHGPFLTENGNWILDLQLPQPPKEPEVIESKILAIPGVLETGFFLSFPSQIIVGYSNGSHKTL